MKLADLYRAANPLESVVCRSPLMELCYASRNTGTLSRGGRRADVSSAFLDRPSHGIHTSFQSQKRQDAKTAQAEAQSQEEGSDLGRWESAAPDVRRLQGHRTAQEACQSPREDRQPPQERLHGREPARRRPRDQESPLYGA